MKKKISLPIVIAIVFLVAALVFTLAYTIAIKSMNKKLTDLNEKQQMFSNYAAVDDFLRENCSLKSDSEQKEMKTIEALVDSYQGAYLFTAEEYNESDFSNPEYATFALANGSRIVVLTEEQYKEFTASENTTDSSAASTPVVTEEE